MITARRQGTYDDAVFADFNAVTYMSCFYNRICADMDVISDLDGVVVAMDGKGMREPGTRRGKGRQTDRVDEGDEESSA